MLDTQYPHLVDGLAVRLSHEACHLRNLSAPGDLVKLGGSAWLFLQELTGSRTVADIAADLAARHGLEPGMIRADLGELLEQLGARGLATASDVPADADRPYLHVVAPRIRSSLHLDVTHRCNETCIHCLVARDQAEMPWEAMTGLVAQAAALGFTSLSLSGGEPTLHPRFWDLLELARGLGFSFTLFTNGLTLRPVQLARLADLRPEQVRISLYSLDPAVHDGITTIPGSQVRTLACLEALHARGVKLYVNCPVMASSFAGFRDVAAWCDARGIERNLDPVIQPTRDRLERHDDLQLTYAQAKEVTGLQQDAPELVCNVQPGQPVCNVGEDPSVDPHLDLYPCPGLRVPLGNLAERSLAELLVDNPELERVAGLSLEDLPACQGCPVRDGCYRCHGHAYQETLDPTQCSRLDRRQATIRRELMVERGTREPLT